MPCFVNYLLIKDQSLNGCDADLFPLIPEVGWVGFLVVGVGVLGVLGIEPVQGVHVLGRAVGSLQLSRQPLLLLSTVTQAQEMEDY